MERPAGALECRAGFGDPIGQGVVGQCHDLVRGNVNVAMHVSNEMRHARGFGDVPRLHDKNFLVGRRHDVRGFSVVMQELTRVKNRSRWKLQREHDSVGRLDEPPHAPAIMRAHGELDHGQSRRKLRMHVEDADGYRRPGRFHGA
jgi:hypothetical protein